MFSTLGHLYRRAQSYRREAKKRATRSPKWPAVERAHLKEHPTCAGCGGSDHVQVHHIKPFHLHPELELDPNNLVSACMDRSECHLRIAHGGSFKAYNPNVMLDLKAAHDFPTQQASIWARAKAGRKQ